MKIFVNGKESDATCILYENTNGLLEVRKDQHILVISKTGSKAVEYHEEIHLEEKGKNVTLKVNGKKIGELKDVRKQEYGIN